VAGKSDWAKLTEACQNLRAAHRNHDRSMGAFGLASVMTAPSLDISRYSCMIERIPEQDCSKFWRRDQAWRVARRGRLGHFRAAGAAKS
jgi:hypothetical protein